MDEINEEIVEELDDEELMVGIIERITIHIANKIRARIYTSRVKRYLNNLFSTQINNHIDFEIFLLFLQKEYRHGERLLNLMVDDAESECNIEHTESLINNLK